MSEISVYFGLGTNLGDRLVNLAQAERRLNTALGACAHSKSGVYETSAWGFEGEDFLNCVLRYDLPCDIFQRPLPRPIQAESSSCPAASHRNPSSATSELTDEQALALLDTVKEIETEMGRVQNVQYDAQGRRIYHSRIIDIDILFIGTQHFALPRLSVPHPLMAQRDFVMIPLNDVASPELVTAFPEIFGGGSGESVATSEI